MKSSMINSKVVVIGAGNVGATIAYTILMSDITSEIVLIDVNHDKAVGETLDMNHGLAYFKQVNVRVGTYEDCADADVILITAGVGRKPGQTRLELAKINISIAKDIAKNIMKHATNPLIVVISNPVDIITYIIQQEMGLPASRVIGSGTTLDTARFRYLISKECEVDVRNVHAYIIGEHGDTQFPVWSRASIAGIPFDDYVKDSKSNEKLDLEKIFEDTKNSGAEIIRLKNATFYGIGMAAARIVSCIVSNEHSILTVSSTLNGEYGVHDVALSTPCIVNRDGIQKVIDIKLNDKEQELMRISAEKLKEAIAEANA